MPGGGEGTSLGGSQTVGILRHGMVLLGSWTCRGHAGGGPVGILDAQGTRRGWSCWDPGRAGDTQGVVLLGSWTCRGHVGGGPVGILDVQGTRRG